MSDISTAGVAGSVDGVTPVYDEFGLWKMWDINAVWDGTTGTNRYVPKVRDFIIDPETFETWRVTHIDEVTLIPTKIQIRPANMSYEMTEVDLLFGTGPGRQSYTMVAYLDKSVTPFVMSLDDRAWVASSLASYARVFKGTDLTSSGKVISAIYNSSGDFLTDKVPLELAIVDTHENKTLRTVQTFDTTEDLADGDLVTMVAYSDAGHVIKKQEFIVWNTAFIRSQNISQKYITGIALKCPFLTSDDTTIEFPLGVPIDALSMVGVISYSNGDTLELPVNGTKFRMLGINQYISSIVGQSVDLVLQYTLGQDEKAVGAVTSDGKFITQQYRLKTVNPNNSYTVKVFGYPVWVDAVNGYEMKFFMTNLDRDVCIDVTDYVLFAENTGAYNPKQYGFLQQKSITLNLNDVSSAFKPYVHAQTMDIYLKRAPDGSQTPWTISHESLTNRVAYGEGLIAKVNQADRWQLSVASGYSTKAEWLEAVYQTTYPLIDLYKETVAPTPTHFEIICGTSSADYTVDEWNQVLTVNREIADYETLFIRFYKKVGLTKQYLSVAAMIVYKK